MPKSHINDINCMYNYAKSGTKNRGPLQETV